MLAEIELFVKDNYSPETMSLFVRGFDIFESLYEDTDYSEPYISILMNSSNAPQSYVADRIRAQLNADALRLMDEFEISVDQDADLSKLISILEGLVLLPDYEDKDSVYGIIESGESSNEIFADLIELVTDLHENEVMQVITAVPSELFTRLMESVDPQGDSNPSGDEQTNRALIEKLKAYRDYTPNKDNFGFRLIRNGYAIGSEFHHYHAAFGTELDTMQDIDAVTDELLTLFYISSDAYLNPLQFYTDNSATIFSDDKRITKVYGMIKNRIAQFEAHYTNKQISDKGIANNAQTRSIQARTEI